MKGAKKVIWEKGGRGIHEIKERKKERKGVKATVSKLYALMTQGATGYFKISFFLSIYVCIIL